MPSILDPLHDYNLRAFPNLDPPLIDSEVIGTPGTTTYTYVATFTTIVGETTKSDEEVVTNGPDTLSASNKVRITCDSVSAAVVTISVFKKVGSEYHLLGTCAAATNQIDDIGQSVDSGTQPPATNTSGRNTWAFMGFHNNRLLQRPELMDLQGIIHRWIRDLGDTFHVDGDAITGCAAQDQGSDLWRFTAGKMYLEGVQVSVDVGQVQLTGSGTEMVGLWVTPTVVTYIDDPKLRNIDEDVGDMFNMEGADRVILEAEWGLSDDTPPESNSAFFVIRTFIDGQPQQQLFTPQQTELEAKIARQRYDAHGNFVVRNFPVKMIEDPDDSTKLIAKVSAGKAYPEGFEVETLAQQSVSIPKARVTTTRNNTTCSSFSNIGGFVVGTANENFDVDAKAIKLQVGSGTDITVTFSGNGKTAAQVCVAIEAVANAIPTSGEPDLVTCTDVGGKVKIAAREGQTLTLKSVASDAYTVLGMTDTKPAVYTTTGTRIYECNEPFVKQITDLSYSVEIVESVVHNGVTHKDLLDNTGVHTILGASDALADCHDSNWDYEYGVDFARDGNYIDFGAYPGGDEPGNGATYYVKYAYQHNVTKGTRTLVKVTDAQVTKGAAGGEDTLVYTGGTCTKVIDGSSVSNPGGNASDVVIILRVNDASGQSVDDYAGQYRLNKNSCELEHDDSEIDWEFATDEPTTSATYYVTYWVWFHDVEGDVVTADSYDMYGEIELAPDGLTPLRDCLDFRTSGIWPEPDENPVFDMDFYLARLDKLAIDIRGTIFRIPGNPSYKPETPNDQASSMSLHVLAIPPYTYKPDHCIITSLEVMRIPQIGLNELRNRIERLEYFQALSLVTSKVADHPAAAEAKALFVDSLAGQGRIDFGFNKLGIRHTAAVDSWEQCLRLPVSEQGLEITINEAASTDITHVGSVVMFDYVEAVYQEQLKASGKENINPDDVFSWQGTLSLDPEQDYYNDVEQLPDLNANFDGEFQVLAEGGDTSDIARQVTYGLWGAGNSVPQGLQVFNAGLSNRGKFQGSTSTQQTSVQSTFPPSFGNLQALGSSQHACDNVNIAFNLAYCMGLNTTPNAQTVRQTAPTTSTSQGTVTSTVVPEHQYVDLGDRVVDVSLLPYCRTKLDDDSPFEIGCTVKGMYPTNVENGDIDVACSIDGVWVDITPTGTSVAGASTYKGKTTVKLSDRGDATFKFTMPTGIPVGARQVKVVWVTDPTASFCHSIFYSMGLRNVKQGTTLGITTATVRTEIIPPVIPPWQPPPPEPIITVWDPLAQTFTVPEGIHYISSVDLFFARKDDKMPVTVDIRETFNGYPTPRVLQTATVDAANINISDDGSASTKFAFTNIVGYLPDEYAIVIKTDTIQYEAYIAELGGIDIVTNEIIGKQAHHGVLFHSPNNSTWDPWTKRDLKFRINEANFENDCQIVFDGITGVQTGSLIAMVTQFMPLGCQIKWSYSTDGGSTWETFLPGINTELGAIHTSINLRVDITASGGTFQMVEKYMGIILLLNQENAKYIGRRATFTDSPDEVHIILDVETDGTNGTGVRTITPYFSIDDGKFWVEVEPPAGFTPSAVDNRTYYEYEFETPDQASVTNATNATPIVITSAGHGFKENAVITVAGVGGNTAANGTWRAQGVTTDTLELVDKDTGADSVGNGAYTSGGTIDLTAFNECRLRLDLATTNRAVTPKVKNIRVICS